MSTEEIHSVLSKYLPSASVDICTEWIITKSIHLKITKDRSSKYGDYRPLPNGHQITLNHNLNPFAFLITFIHEVAHLNTCIKYKRGHEPHGYEWKYEFKILLKHFIDKNVFPEDIKKALTKYIQNPAASSCSDYALTKTLRKYDPVKESNHVHLEDLPDNAIFRFHKSHENKFFQKGHQMRTRFHCTEIKSKQVYWVSPLAEVIVV